MLKKILFSQRGMVLISSFLRKLPIKLSAKLLFKITRFQIVNETSKNILFCINAAAFQKDLMELGRINDIKYVIMDQYWFSIFLYIFFEKDKLFLNHFYGIEKNVKLNYGHQVKNSIEFLESFFHEVEKRYGKISLFLLPGFDQGGVFLINEYAKNNDKKVFSFYYEHYTIPMIKNANQNCYLHYQVKSPGGKLLVWHQSMKDLLLNANFTNSDSIIVTGPPRLHRWHNYIEEYSERKYITLLSFPGTEYWAPYTYIDILLCLRNISLKYENFKFIVKCKDQSHVNETLNILNGNNGKLVISSEMDMVDTLSQSKVAIGFNSLSFLEAILSRAYLICPFWGDSNLDPYLLQVNPMTEEVKNIMEIANSREEFCNTLERLLQMPDFSGSLDARINFFNQYIYFNPKNRTIDIFEKLFKEALNET